MRFDFGQREGDLQWMLAESRKPVKGLPWLKEKYYELLGKCEKYPVPFQLIYDMETIAGRIFPKAARKFTFLRDPIRDYFKIRMRQYDAEIKQLLQADQFHITDLLPLIGTMNRKDGRSMVSMFLSSLKDGKIHKALAARAGPEVQKVIDAIADLPLTDQLENLSELGAALSRADVVLEAEEEDRHSFSAHASSPESSRDSSLDTGEAAFAGEKVEDFAASVNPGEDYGADEFADLDAKQELDEAAPEPLAAGDGALAADSFSPGRDESIAAAVPVDPARELSLELPIGPPEEHSAQLSAEPSAEPPGHKPGFEPDDLRTPLPLEQSGAFQAGSGQGFYSGNYDAERIVQEVTSGDQPALDLRSDKAYKEFLIEQSELVLAEKNRIFEQSGLADQVNRALELRDEEQSVHLLPQVHPLCFLSAEERLLRGIDALNSPLGKIMAHLSQMYRKLNVPDMRAYVDYYTEQLDAAGLFDTFPAIRERLINYRNSLIDPPPELLKQVHLGLKQIEDDSKSDHRRCVELQVKFLHSCLASDVFARVWPTIAVILENLVSSELQSLGEQRPQASSWQGRLEAEERLQPRPMPAILEDVEPASSESLGSIRSLAGVQGHPDFLSSRTGNPEEDAKRIEQSLAGLFAEDSQAALELSGEILNAPAYSLVEKEAAHSVLSRQSLADASELSHFHQVVRGSGGLAEQRECAQSFRGGLSLSLVDSTIGAIDIEHAQNRSMSLLHEFLRSKDREAQSRMFPEIQRSPHIPEAMKSLFRKGSDAGVVEKAMEGITTSNLSNANKLKLLGLLKKMAVHRKWLTPLTEEKLNRKILFYERILAADQKRMEELAARKTFYTSRREEIRKALLGHNARSIYAMETGETSESKSRAPGVQNLGEDHKTHEEMHRAGFSDEFLDGLIQNRLRAARWYGKLPEHSREDLHKQAAVPGKAQVLVNQIQKDNAFKKVLRHLQPPVDPAVLEKVSLQFPEPEYQASLAKFRKPPSRTPSPPNASEPAPPAIGPDAKFDQLLDEALLSGPDLPPIAAGPIEMPELPHTPVRAPAHTPRVQAHAEPAHESSSHAAAVSRPGAAPQSAHAHPAHTNPAAHPHPAAPPHEHRPSKSGVDGVAASLARGFSSLFGKSTSSQKPAEKAASGAPAVSSKAREKKSGAKKAKEAAATLMKGISVYSKGEVFLSEKDLKSLEKDMEKHPDSKRLIEDHAYLFKLDHPDTAQFQPPIFVIIPALKACNHDQAKKKLEMGKIEKAISSAPAKKKPHLQALLTFMERYKTK